MTAPVADPPKIARGLSCPACGAAPLEALYTRHRAGKVVRVRKCAACGRRVRTEETIVAKNAPGRS